MTSKTRVLLYLACIVLYCAVTTATTCTGDKLTVRAIDGSCNNLANPTFGKPETIYYRTREGASYADTQAPFQTPVVAGRPKIRNVSNTLLARSSPRATKTCKRLSILHSFFGQLTLHDLALTKKPVLEPDPNAEGNFDLLILEDDDPFLFLPFPPFTRKTGVPFNVPAGIERSFAEIVDGVREPLNSQTHFLDLSTVYWHNQTFLDAFRTNSGGEFIIEDHTWVSAYRPENIRDSTTNAETRKIFGMLPSVVTTQTPFTPGQHVSDPEITIFATADDRGSTNGGLLSMHNLFYQEHNKLAKELQVEHPTWTDEQLFQKARAINIAQFQHITYNEWIPALFGDLQVAKYLGKWSAYDPNVDPRVSTLFAGSAARYGHSTILNLVPLYDKCGKPDPTLGWGGNMVQATGNGGTQFPLRGVSDLFPKLYESALISFQVTAAGSIDNLLRATMFTPIEQIDHLIDNALRNFNIPTQVNVGVDIPSLNMARSRDNGIPDFATVYESWNPLVPGAQSLYDACGSSPSSPGTDDLACYTSWVQEYPDIPNFAANIRDIYSKLIHLDPWFAFLAEKKEPGSNLGRTTTRVILDQFRRLRDGDRFWYENQPNLGNMPGINEPGLTQQELDAVRQVTMKHLLERNTDGFVSEDPFIAQDTPSPTCSTVPSIRLLDGANVLKEALFNGNIINVTQVQNNVLTLEATVSGPVGSVTFDMSGVGSPLSLTVNVPASVSIPLTLSPVCDSQNTQVDLTIVATPFSQANGSGSSGFPLSTIITIVGNNQC